MTDVPSAETDARKEETLMCWTAPVPEARVDRHRGVQETTLYGAG